MNITLAPSGGLLAHLPSGRTIDLGDNPEALKFLQRILRDEARGTTGQRGYIGAFPTQEIVNAWKGQVSTEASREADRRRKALTDLGINPDDFILEL